MFNFDEMIKRQNQMIEKTVKMQNETNEKLINNFNGMYGTTPGYESFYIGSA